ncbi:MAG: GNAT family N-acetyltransferase [Rhodothermia bacterium]|nr:GNAT family N-acetyltransferase [Rhodothermia bacterium]
MRTNRLILRRWRREDRQPFAEMNADPRVMKYFPATLSRAESDALVDRLEAGFEANGFGFWAVEVVGVSDFVGFVGLSVPRFEAHFTPAVEIGWRIAAEHWNNGFATEGARAALRHAFETLLLDEVVALAVPANRASRRVMEKIGMIHNAEDDFDHPELPDGHPQRRHVLYRIACRQWTTGRH